MWIIYIIVCSKDNSLYTGITNNLNKRLDAHNSGKGAKYTKSRRPVKLLKYFEAESKSEALKIECKIKKLTKKQKYNLTNIDNLSAKYLMEDGYGS